MYTSLYTLPGFISYNKRVFIHKVIRDEKLPLHSAIFYVAIGRASQELQSIEMSLKL